MAAETSKADQLKLLGDPSGQQNSDYWNSWFDVVCKQDHEPFEWYCDVDEVVRVLKHHLIDSKPLKTELDEETKQQPKMIHPGSGTSLCPLKLREFFPYHEQVVIDISDVAVDEMRLVHDKYHNQLSPGNGDASNSPSSSKASPPVQYQVADVLKPPLPIDSSTCDVWLDKGFIDAVFSKDCNVNDQPRLLFNEAHRLLTNDNGVIVIITLAEEHSLNIIMNIWLQHQKETNEGLLTTSWHPTLHVWEISPITGNMRPFAFVLSKTATTNSFSGERCMKFYSIDGTVEDLYFPNDLHDGAATSKVSMKLEESRNKFQDNVMTNDSSADDKDINKMLITLEVKPEEPDANLELLASRILKNSWNTSLQDAPLLKPLWLPFKDEQDGGEPVAYKVVPIGYGISKLILQCVISSDHIDELVDVLEEWTEANDIGGIQSVDITDTIPVCSTKNLPPVNV